MRPYRRATIPIADRAVLLVQPLTYMNRSGEVLPALLNKHGLSPAQLVVIVDTLDLAPGRCRMKRKGSSAGHRGLASIINELGTEEFMRIYIGVGRPPAKGEVVDYVLGTPPDDERRAIDACIDRAAKGVCELVQEPSDTVIQRFNSNG